MRPLFYIWLVVLISMAGGVVAEVEPVPVHPDDRMEGHLIKPPHVYARVALLRAEIDLIRFEMGQARITQAEIEVEGAVPREVFFQALTLFSKVDRLCFEQARERAPLLELPDVAIGSPEVFHIINLSLERLRIVKKKIGIPELSTEPQLDPSKTSTDVFRSIVQANRQLNLMLNQRFSTSKVYEQVSLAISHAARGLLARFPAATRIPDVTILERGVLPKEVYRCLIGCFERIHQIARRSGFEMLTLSISEQSIEEVRPSDIYDIASLIVCELAYLHAQIPNAQPPRDVYHPGQKFWSHVNQRATILDAQLIELGALVSKNPRWLESP